MPRYKGLHGEKSLSKSPSSPVHSSEATSVTNVLDKPSRDVCVCVRVHKHTHTFTHTYKRNTQGTQTSTRTLTA